MFCCFGSLLLAGSVAAVPDEAQEVLVRISVPESANAFEAILTLPGNAGPHPAALLVSPPGRGSGLPGGSPEWQDLAQRLARGGIATLRAAGEAAGGSHERDVAMHLEWLLERPELERERIGLIAHGEGTLLAALAAAELGWPAFVVLLSPPATDTAGAPDLLDPLSRIESPVLLLEVAADGQLERVRATFAAAGNYNAFAERVDALLGREDGKTLASSVVERLAAFVGDCIGSVDARLLPRGREPLPELWLRSVRVVDVRAGECSAPTDVVVRDGRIARIGAGEEPGAGAVVVQGAGRYLSPGLWDAHVHLSFHGADALALFAASGVTAVRDMGGDPEELGKWRDRVDSGEWLGPRILRAGPFLDGEKPNFQWRRFLDSVEDVERALDEIEDLGADLVKVHSRLPREVYFELAAQCRERGLSLCGHVPVGVGPLEACEAGQASLEHADVWISALARMQDSPAPSWTEAYRWWQSAEGDGAFARVAELGTRFVPTLIAGRVILPRMGQMAALDPWLFDVTGRAGRAGVRLVAGSDHGRRVTGIVPGESLQRELELLVEAGLTPARALRAATLEAAELCGLGGESGTVETGRRADLLLLAQNPLESAAAVRTLEGVVLRGAWIPAAELRTARAQAREAAGALARAVQEPASREGR